MSSSIGVELLFITQIALLVLNYVNNWNLPWYLLWAPLVLIGILVVIALVMVIIYFIFRALGV